MTVEVALNAYFSAAIHRKQLKTMKISWREAGLARYTKNVSCWCFFTFPPTSMALSLTVCHNQNTRTRMPMHQQRR